MFTGTDVTGARLAPRRRSGDALPMDRSGRGRSVAGIDPPHAHVLGIDGRGMSGLAQNLVQKGMAVTGSETVPGAGSFELRRLGVKIRIEPRGHALHAGTRLLVHGPEVAREHSARLVALRRGIRQETPASWLDAQMQGRLGVVVAGGREASVAAAMTGFVLVHAGLDPSVVLGTAAPQLGGWSREGQGAHLIAAWSGEDEAFGDLQPRMVVLLNVGSDPWIDHERWSDALRRSLPALPEDGHVLTLGHPSLFDCEPGAGGVPKGFEWVSLQRGADWWGTDLREESGRFRFRVFHRGRYVIEVRLLIPGRRGVVAALAAVATCDRLGVPTSAIRQGLEEFTGLSRDFECRGSFRGVTLIDDESEDASSVRDTLAIARRTFSGRRLWAVHGAGGTGESAPVCVRLFGRGPRIDHRARADRRRREPLADSDRELMLRGCRGATGGDPGRSDFRPGPRPSTR